MITTKKLLKNLTKDNKMTTSGTFLSPDIIKYNSKFIGISNSKEYLLGYIVYIGKEITADDFLKKCSFEINDINKAKKIIESYFKQINNFKIGNVLKISEKMELVFVANSYRTINSPKNNT